MKISRGCDDSYGFIVSLIDEHITRRHRRFACCQVIDELSKLMGARISAYYQIAAADIIYNLG